jgi:hypothetical protein
VRKQGSSTCTRRSPHCVNWRIRLGNAPEPIAHGTGGLPAETRLVGLHYTIPQCVSYFTEVWPGETSWRPWTAEEIGIAGDIKAAGPSRDIEVLAIRLQQVLKEKRLSARSITACTRKLAAIYVDRRAADRIEASALPQWSEDHSETPELPWSTDDQSWAPELPWSTGTRVRHQNSRGQQGPELDTRTPVLNRCTE